MTVNCLAWIRIVLVNPATSLIMYDNEVIVALAQTGKYDTNYSVINTYDISQARFSLVK